MNKKNTFNPDYAFPPGDTLGEGLYTGGYTIRDLAIWLSITIEEAGKLLAGDRPMTHDYAVELERRLDIKAHIWENLEKDYRDHIKRLLNEKLPHNHQKNRE